MIRPTRSNGVRFSSQINTVERSPIFVANYNGRTNTMVKISRIICRTKSFHICFELTEVAQILWSHKVAAYPF